MKKLFTIFTLTIILIISKNVSAQTNIFPSTGSVGIGTTSPSASSLLEIKSTTKGMLIPRLTQTQRNSIASPVTGLLVYQTDNYPGFYYYDGSTWNAIGYWKKNSTSVFFNSGNVGVGTLSPKARLQVIDSSVLFSAAGSVPSSPHNTPISGAGRRMMWYPDKAAFRTGYAGGNEWDASSIGVYSFASGYATTASGGLSTSMGYQTIASGDQSTAMGYYTTASGQQSTAIGGNTIASSLNATAMGYQTTASGTLSTAMGYKTTASGLNSVAMGYETTASGVYSSAMGSLVTTNSQPGSFVIGDEGTGRSGSIYYSDVPNQMQMVFAGGYKLYTGSSASGVQMNGGDNSWSAVSDSTKKEKKLLVKGEDVLNKISKFKLYTWNYKGQDAAKFRHYGPMAQDFHNAFGKDAIGTIGNDTLINQQDFLGISFIAIQALEKRTAIIKTQQQQIDSLNDKLNALTDKISQIENAMSQCCSSFSSNMQSVINNQSLQKNSDAARLDQNIPNPFNGSTSISYYIPSGFHSAQLIITDVSDNVLKKYALSKSGYGKQIISGNELANGAYLYSLLIDGKLIDTKKMLLSK